MGGPPPTEEEIAEHQREFELEAQRDIIDDPKGGKRRLAEESSKTHAICAKFWAAFRQSRGQG